MDDTPISLILILAIATLGAFIFLYWPVIYATFKGTMKEPTAMLVTFATILSGLFGGITAGFFHVNLDEIKPSAAQDVGHSVDAEAHAGPQGTTADNDKPAEPVGDVIKAIGATFNVLSTEPTNGGKQTQKTAVPIKDTSASSGERSPKQKWVDRLKKWCALVYLLTGLAAARSLAKPGLKPGGTEPVKPPQLISNLGFVTIGVMVSLLKSIF